MDIMGDDMNGMCITIQDAMADVSIANGDLESTMYFYKSVNITAILREIAGMKLEQNQRGRQFWLFLTKYWDVLVIEWDVRGRQLYLDY